METNNLIESWHSLLKRQYITNRKRRVDMVVYVLTKAVEYDFKIDNFQSFNRIGRMSPTHIHLATRQRIANQINLERAEEMISFSDSFLVEIQSFTNAPQAYRVVLDSSSKMESCSCLDWQQYKLPCKHMFLLERNYINISLPDILFPTIPIENIRPYVAPADPTGIQENRDFILQIKRIERNFRKIIDNPDITSDVQQELRYHGDQIESIIESFNNRRAFIHQEY